MKKTILLTLIISTISVISIQAQNFRLNSLADQLQRNANELAERSYEDFARGGSNRNELNNLLVSQQLKATAEVFRRLVNDRRNSSDLRDVANALNDLARKSAGSANSSQWRDVKNDIEDIIKETSGRNDRNDNRDGDRNRDRNGRDSGKLTWNGTVDDEVHLVIRGNALQIRTISGTRYNDGMYNFSSPLPNQRVNVKVDKKNGRGSAKVIQQPSRENNFTTIIQVLDKNGGAKEYELEISWSR